MLLLALTTVPSFAGEPCADQASIAANSAELVDMYEAGEADRLQRSAEALAVLDRDEKRAKLMMKYDKKGWLCTPQDKWYAAWLMQQSDKLEVLERAYELATEAQDAHVDRANWLVAFAFDHMRVASGHLQAFGTQTRVDAVGRNCLIELEGTTTDAQRELHGVPLLTEVYRSVLDANGYPDDAPTEQRLRRHELLCDPEPIRAKDVGRVPPPQ